MTLNRCQNSRPKTRTGAGTIGTYFGGFRPEIVRQDESRDDLSKNHRIM